MWFASRSKKRSEIDSKALKALQDRVDLLSSDVSEMKREMLPLTVDFNDLYDKVKNQLAKLSGRDRAKKPDNGELIPVTPDTIAADIRSGTFRIGRHE